MVFARRKDVNTSAIGMALTWGRLGNVGERRRELEKRDGNRVSLFAQDSIPWLACAIRERKHGGRTTERLEAYDER